MVLADDFRTLLTIGKQLVTDPAVKQAIADDLATLESKAEAGVEAVEQHIAGWFHAHYQLPAPTPADGDSDTNASEVDGVSVQGGTGLTAESADASVQPAADPAF